MLEKSNWLARQAHVLEVVSSNLTSNNGVHKEHLLFMYLNYDLKPSIFGKFIFYTRLFANLMAGHTLLKVIVGFSWSMLLLEDFLAVFHIVPLLILVLLMGLELGVALIQAYVFTILTCIYLNDAINLH